MTLPLRRRRLFEYDLEAMLERAAELGTLPALSNVGPGGKDAVRTIHDMRSLLACLGFVRRTAVQTAVHVITNSALIAPLNGIAMKLRWLGPTRVLACAAGPDRHSGQ